MVQVLRETEWQNCALNRTPLTPLKGLGTTIEGPRRIQELEKGIEYYGIFSSLQSWTLISCEKLAHQHCLGKGRQSQGPLFSQDYSVNGFWQEGNNSSVGLAMVKLPTLLYVIVTKLSHKDKERATHWQRKEGLEEFCRANIIKICSIHVWKHSKWKPQ